MNFGFSEEQELLRQEVRKFLDQQCPIEEVRRLAKEPEGYSREHWKALAELGWTGLILPETVGGAGLGWVDLVVLIEETGRSLFPSPLISSLLCADAISDLASAEQKKRILPGFIDGTTIGALAVFDDPGDLRLDAIELRGRKADGGYRISGEKRHVEDINRADLVLLAFRSDSGELILAMLDRNAPGVEVNPIPSIDESKRLGYLRLDSVPIAGSAVLARGRDAERGALRLLDRGAVAVTAEMIGAGEAALALTVQFAKDRVQFGSPIGRYQGVKHPLAEIYVDLESIKSLLYHAAWALDASPDDVPFSASKAKAFASEAFARIGVDGVQLHGAVGFTEEYDIQLYLKRSKWARPAFGDENFHLDRVAELGGL